MDGLTHTKQLLNLLCTVYKAEILALCLCSFCMSLSRTSNSAANTLVFMWI